MTSSVSPRNGPRISLTEEARTVTIAWAQIAKLANISSKVARKALTWLNDGE
jgi:hypothetical protein